MVLDCNGDCKWENGECIGNNITAWKRVPNPIVGDGFCDDKTNNAGCRYDGGDCCLSDMITDYCSNCSCSVNGVITSPGYPGYYDTNLDLSWLIQLPHGQLIEIIFISYDIEFWYVP